MADVHGPLVAPVRRVHVLGGVAAEVMDAQPRLASYAVCGRGEGDEAAARVARALIERGFREVFLLEGGWTACKAAGLPAEGR